MCGEGTHLAGTIPSFSHSEIQQESIMEERGPRSELLGWFIQVLVPLIIICESLFSAYFSVILGLYGFISEISSLANVMCRFALSGLG